MTEGRPYTLARIHDHFEIARHVRSNNTLMERNTHFARFCRYRVQSTDGRCQRNKGQMKEERSKKKKKPNKKKTVKTVYNYKFKHL